MVNVSTKSAATNIKRKASSVSYTVPEPIKKAQYAPFLSVPILFNSAIAPNCTAASYIALLAQAVFDKCCADPDVAVVVALIWYVDHW